MKTSSLSMYSEWIAALMLAMIPPWLSTTPLATPVVPEVKMIEAASVGSISATLGSAALGSAAALGCNLLGVNTHQ
jgi:hypothetical protein